MVTAFSPLEFGWQYIVAATIEGVPIVFTESATGKTLPTGYTAEDPSLIIEGSAEVGQTVDRKLGIGVGLPFTLRLQDTETVREWIGRWSYEARLTSDLASDGATVTVDSTSGWPASGSFYIGNERITYGGLGGGGTTFTGCGGANRGGVGYAYGHKSNSAGAFVTDSPRYYRGRELKLYVLPVDPTGYVTGSAVLDDAEMIWRGYISTAPRRVGVHWQLEALSIDRKLARPLAALITGRVVATDYRTTISKQAEIRLVVTAYRDDLSTLVFKHELTWHPFEALSETTLYSPSKIQQAIVDGFALAVSNKSATAAIGALEFSQHAIPYDANDPHAGKPLVESSLRMGVTIKYNANIAVVGFAGSIFGVSLGDASIAVLNMIVPVASVDVVVKIPRGQWESLSSDPTRHGVQKIPAPTIRLDDGAIADVSSTGIVEIGGRRFSYGIKLSADDLLYLGDIVPLDDAGDPVGDLLKKTATIILEDSGSPATVIRRMIESSGTTSLRGTYDTLKAGQGYAIDDDAVDEAAIGDVIDSGSAGSLTMRIAGGNESLVEHMGGLLSMTQTAIVARQDTSATNRAIKISAAHTSAGGSAHVTTINDSHLLTRAGEPVTPKHAAVAPNIITFGSAWSDNLRIFNDHGAIAAQGANEFDVVIPVDDDDAIGDVAPFWAAARFSDVAAQILELRIVPWIDCDVGDVVQLSLSHPSIWSYSGAEPGYEGQGRVLGKAIDLATSAVTLTVLIDGIAAGAGLCPSAEVSAFAGTAANPSTVDIPTKYEPLISKALSEAGGNVRVVHYRPGEVEAAANYLMISSATLTSGICRLAVASISAGSIVANDTRLTWPETANDSAYQALYMHVSDGSRWM